MRGVSHADLLRTTSAKEIAEYRALHLIDPLWDGERIENSLASLSNLTFNLNRHPDTEATTVKDWTPDYAAWTQAKSDEQLSDEFDRWYEQQQRGKP
jgi:hypothetical protein